MKASRVRLGFIPNKWLFNLWMKVLVVQSCPTLCNCMDCSLPGSFVHGILQARILEWVAFPFSRGYFPVVREIWRLAWRTCISNAFIFWQFFCYQYKQLIRYLRVLSLSTSSFFFSSPYLEAYFSFFLYLYTTFNILIKMKCLLLSGSVQGTGNASSVWSSFSFSK